jgi:hypothetical protein
VIGNDTIGAGHYVVAQFCAVGNPDAVDCSRFPQKKQGAAQANRIEYIRHRIDSSGLVHRRSGPRLGAYGRWIKYCGFLIVVIGVGFIHTDVIKINAGEQETCTQ